VRRELLDHVVVLNDRHLRRLLSDYVAYHHNDRTHLGLAKATPAGRPRQARPVGDAEIIALPRRGGLHHRYEWRVSA
jgi:putative transposase